MKFIIDNDHRLKISPNSHRELKAGFLLAIFGTLLFSLKSIFIKFLYQQGLTAHQVLTLRMALSLPIYIIVLLGLLGKPDSVLPKFKTLINIIILGFFGYYLASLFDLMGLMYISAQLERLTLFTYPFLVAIFGALFFKQKLTTRLIFALIISYLGLGLVMFEELSLTGNHVSEGVSYVLLSALSFALYVLFSKQLIKTIGSQMFTSIVMITSCLFGLLHGLIFIDFSAFSITVIAWFWMVMLVIFSTVIPSYMMSAALDKISATQVSVIGILGPVFTIASAIYFLNEAFSLMIAIGMAFILIGVLMTCVTK